VIDREPTSKTEIKTGGKIIPKRCPSKTTATALVVSKFLKRYQKALKQSK
jgi:hypothetical protein